jgi:hypothetical protein
MQSITPQFCDNCIFGEMQFEPSPEIRCSLKRRVLFVLPDPEESASTRRWGWQWTFGRHCPDFAAHDFRRSPRIPKRLHHVMALKRRAVAERDAAGLSGTCHREPIPMASGTPACGSVASGRNHHDSRGAEGNRSSSGPLSNRKPWTVEDWRRSVLCSSPNPKRPVNA